jgi:hypothetical protein
LSLCGATDVTRRLAARFFLDDAVEAIDVVALATMPIRDLEVYGTLIPRSEKSPFAYDSEDRELTKSAAHSMSASLTRPPSPRVFH